jgi:hypothetical protein
MNIGRAVHDYAPSWGCSQRQERKVRLWAAACVRQVAHLLTERGLNALEQAENYDGCNAPKRDPRLMSTILEQWKPGAYWANLAAWRLGCRRRATASLAQAVLSACRADPVVRARARGLFHCVTADFIVPPEVLAWQGGTVRRLAQGIEDERDFVGMAVLADALGEAGCTDAALLAHCRTPLHCRGCGLLDAILGDRLALAAVRTTGVAALS